MKEIKDIIAAYDAATKEGKDTALATVVHLQGSAYRRPGARMLVTTDGKLTGAISGGCLEGDTLRKAQLAMVQKKPVLVTYDTTDDEEDTLGVGLGCNGIITILIEPLNAGDEYNAIELLKKLFLHRQAGVIVTLFSLDKQKIQPGTILVATGSDTYENSKAQNIESLLYDDARQVMISRKSIFKDYGLLSQLSGFIEYVDVPVSLLVFGAGNDSIPLVQMAGILGWETTVIDGRANYATRERFAVNSKIVISKPGNILQHIIIDERTVAALMTHNYNYDIAVLKQLAQLPVAYIGVLGPKKKMDKMLEEMQRSGIALSEKERAVIYGPAGLDVGAETSEEIALSIISEIKAVLANRSGSFLRYKTSGIHAEDNVHSTSR